MFQDDKGGTPQRLLWMRVTDETCPDVLPETPDPLPVIMPPWGGEIRADVHNGQFVISVPLQLGELVRGNRRLGLRGKQAPLDGHLFLVQEKTAFALAVLDGRTFISMDDWNLAGVVMRESNWQRGKVQQYTNQQQLERRLIAADNKVAYDERVAQTTRETTFASVLRQLGGSETGALSWSAIRRNLSKDQQACLLDVIDELLERGVIVEYASGGNGTKGRVFRLTKSEQQAA